jgi:hypothetical protein
MSPDQCSPVQKNKIRTHFAPFTLYCLQLDGIDSCLQYTNSWYKKWGNTNCICKVYILPSTQGRNIWLSGNCLARPRIRNKSYLYYRYYASMYALNKTVILYPDWRSKWYNQTHLYHVSRITNHEWCRNALLEK